MTPFEHSRATLYDGQTFGVWSLIVTFFGDMAQEPNDCVSGTTLTTISETLGIKPQAMRVALHRLRKDGWIDSVKTGRRSAYFLTKTSRMESAKASNRIYAQRPPIYSGFNVLLAPNNELSKLDPVRWIMTGSEISVSFEKVSNPPKDSILTHHEGPVPDWLSKRLISSEIVEGYEAFNLRLRALPTDGWTQMSPHEIAALRILLVHSWRRLVLRHPCLPSEAFPSNCPIDECYDGMSKLLTLLPRPILSKLG